VEYLVALWTLELTSAIVDQLVVLLWEYCRLLYWASNWLLDNFWWWLVVMVQVVKLKWLPMIVEDTTFWTCLCHSKLKLSLMLRFCMIS
jgi:hypothetical protein